MGLLLLLMTVGGLMTASLLLIIAVVAKKLWLRNFVLGGVAIWFVFYFAMLFGVSLFSTEKTLALNEPKEFCGFYFDCHMHTAITDVRKTKNIGDKTAKGEFYIVKVKVLSDARRATLGLLTVDARVIDERKQQFERDLQAEIELGEQPPFEKKITPLESFEKEIVFDLPPDSTNPLLDIREGYGIDHAIEAVLIGDEDSIFHKRNYFKLEEQKRLTYVN